MSRKNTNKYWDKVHEIEDLSLKIDFYRLFLMNIDELLKEKEGQTSALKFYLDNFKKHINRDPEIYFHYIEKAVELDCENENMNLEDFDIDQMSMNLFEEYQSERGKVENYFILYEKYRQNLEILDKDKSFIDILIKNKDISYSNEDNLLVIKTGLVQNYLEVQVIKLIQELIIERFNIDYNINLPIDEFKKIIDKFNIFLDRQGYKISPSKDLKLPRKEIIEFIIENINFSENPQKQINEVISYMNIYLNVEADYER